MDGAAILFILAAAGVVTILIFALKGLLDQLPDLLESAGQVRDAWDRFRRRDDKLRPAVDQTPPEPEAHSSVGSSEEPKVPSPRVAGEPMPPAPAGGDEQEPPGDDGGYEAAA
ncbi:hypothetical protein AMK33_37115 [Streptomyces sp. CB02400]|nr:hypothetical protein AMK33_37115 [Streptomyces sp. CB02400]